MKLGTKLLLGRIVGESLVLSRRYELTMRYGIETEF